MNKKNKKPTIGLALGAGGARGFAHIGVIETLIKNKIPIDFISGVSMGSIIGGIYAKTKDIKKIKTDVENTHLKQVLSLIDLSFKNGIIGGAKIKRYIENYIGDVKFDDLKIPFSAVATDLNTGEAIVINEGSVLQAIQASISIPLVLKPFQKGNLLLIDGGLSMPVPAKVVKNMGADIVVSVNLDAKYFTKKISYDKLSFNNIVKQTKEILLHNLSKYDAEYADITIEPSVGDIKWDDFTEGKKAIATGAKATEKIIAKLLKQINKK